MSSRDIGSSIVTAINTGVIRPVLFVEMQWPSGTTRAWNGVGPYTWGGNEFTGVGLFGGCSSVRESSDGRANGITLTLSGIPAGMQAIILTEHYQGRTARLWLGFMTASQTLIQDPPYELFRGRMNVASSRKGGKTATISLEIESRLIILQQKNGHRTTNEDQQERYPGDTGYRFIVGINQARPDNWGQPGNSLAARNYPPARQTY